MEKTMMKKLMLTAAALAITAAPLAASAEPFGHNRGGDFRGQRFDGDRGYRGGWDGYRGYRGGWDGDRGDGAAAAGLFGFVLGAALANDHPGYYQDCYWQSRPVVGPYGYVHYERVEICR